MGMDSKFVFTEEQRAELVRWRDELRITEKPQGSGQLRSVDGEYCCIGVYADMTYPNRWIMEDEIWSIQVERDKNLIFDDCDEIGYYDLDLPDKLIENLGLTKTVKTQDGLTTLQAVFIHMNDEEHMTFAEIADQIDHLLEHGNFTDDFQWRYGAEDDGIVAMFDSENENAEKNAEEV